MKKVLALLISVLAISLSQTGWANDLAHDRAKQSLEAWGYSEAQLRAYYGQCLQSGWNCAGPFEDYVVALSRLMMGSSEVPAEESAQRAWLESEYPLYVAKYGFISFDEFTARFSSRYNPHSFSDWYPGANCDDNLYTQDYCGEKYFSGDFTWFFSGGIIPPIPECPGFTQLYQDISATYPSPTRLLDTLLKTYYADPELGQILEGKGVTLSEVCAPMVSAYQELLEEMSRQGFKEILPWYQPWYQFSLLGLEQFTLERIGQHFGADRHWSW